MQVLSSELEVLVILDWVWKRSVRSILTGPGYLGPEAMDNESPEPRYTQAQKVGNPKH